MKNFIEIQNRQGEPELININNIASVAMIRGECFIAFVGGLRENPSVGAYAQETYEEVKTKIAQAIAK
jgi:hypothetical protein